MPQVNAQAAARNGRPVRASLAVRHAPYSRKAPNTKSSSQIGQILSCPNWFQRRTVSAIGVRIPMMIARLRLNEMVMFSFHVDEIIDLVKVNNNQYLPSIVVFE